MWSLSVLRAKPATAKGSTAISSTTVPALPVPPMSIDALAASWAQQSYLKASNTAFGASFGGDFSAASSVAASGDTIVIGASGEDSNGTGVNGNQANTSAQGAGAAYVFDLNDPAPEPELPDGRPLPVVYEPFFNSGSALVSGSGFASSASWGLGNRSVSANLQYPGLASSGGSFRAPSASDSRNYRRNLGTANQMGADGTVSYIQLSRSSRGNPGSRCLQWLFWYFPGTPVRSLCLYRQTGVQRRCKVFDRGSRRHQGSVIKSNSGGGTNRVAGGKGGIWAGTRRK